MLLKSNVYALAGRVSSLHRFVSSDLPSTTPGPRKIISRPGVFFEFDGPVRIEPERFEQFALFEAFFPLLGESF